MRPRHCHPSPRGGTLLETMIALTVLAIGLTGVANALVASARVDRQLSARAAAHAVAVDLVRAIERWDFDDPRLSVVNVTLARLKLSEPEVVDFSVSGTPPVVTETLSPVPDHGEADCGYCGRDLAAASAQGAVNTYRFRRYWSVVVDPDNPALKLIAVHVTYSRTPEVRGVVTVHTSVADMAALVRTTLGTQ